MAARLILTPRPASKADFEINLSYLILQFQDSLRPFRN